MLVIVMNNGGSLIKQNVMSVDRNNLCDMVVKRGNSIIEYWVIGDQS